MNAVFSFDERKLVDGFQELVDDGFLLIRPVNVQQKALEATHRDLTSDPISSDAAGLRETQGRPDVDARDLLLTSVDASTGEAAWKSRPPGDGFLILVDGHLVIVTKDGSLHVAKATPDGDEALEFLEPVLETVVSAAERRTLES